MFYFALRVKFINKDCQWGQILLNSLRAWLKNETVQLYHHYNGYSLFQ